MLQVSVPTAVNWTPESYCSVLILVSKIHSFMLLKQRFCNNWNFKHFSFGMGDQDFQEVPGESYKMLSCEVTIKAMLLEH